MVEQEIDLRELIHIVLEKWWIIAVFAIAAVLITAIVTINFITPMYEAKATLFIGKESSSVGGIGIDLGDLQLDSKLVADYQELIKTRLVTEEVINDLNLDITVGRFVNYLNISIIRNSRFMHVVYEDADPVLAVKIANKLSDVLVEKATDIVGVKNVQIVDRAIPNDNPVSPNLKLNLAIAGVLGIMLALFCILLLNMLDNTIKKEADLEKLGLSVLGVIPKFEGDERGNDNKKFNFFK